MFNEYMCSNFVAGEILSEILPTSSNFSRRLGIVAPEPVQALDRSEEYPLDTPERTEALNQNVLFDQGSKGYQNWLKK